MMPAMADARVCPTRDTVVTRPIMNGLMPSAAIYTAARGMNRLWGMPNKGSVHRQTRWLPFRLTNVCKIGFLIKPRGFSAIVPPAPFCTGIGVL